MGARVAENPVLLRPAVAGAVLSTVATVVQITILVAAASSPTLSVPWQPLLLAGIAAAAYGLVFTLSAVTSSSDVIIYPGEAFSDSKIANPSEN